MSHLHVVEIGSSPASAYCARMFADFGARVSKVEPPGGDTLRRAAPLTPAGHSAWFAFLNVGKASVMIDAGAPDAAARLAALIADCDILVDGRDIDGAQCPALDIAAAKDRNPGLIHVEASWFGKSGPYASYKATDTVVRALAGTIKLTGAVDGPPTFAPDFQAGIMAGLWAYIAASAAVVSRSIDGRGRTNTVSIFEANLAVSEYVMFEAFTHGDVMRRIGLNRFWPTFPVGIYEASEGWVGVTTVTPAQWRSFCDMLGLIELRDDPTLVIGVDRFARMEEIEATFIPKLKTRTAHEWFAEGLRRNIPIVVVPAVGELIANAEARARGAIVPIAAGEEAGFAVGSTQRLTATPPRRGGRVPALGEHVETTTVQPPRERPAAHAVSIPRLPLEGIRVVDFSMGWAGPVATRTLADLGADIIKIESCQYADWWRGVDRRPAYVAGREYEKMARFCIMNRNKRGITLDLTQPDGVRLAKALIATADLVVDNYSVEVLPKLGLGYEVLAAINPRLVVMSMSAFGSGSVHRTCRGYGSTLEQASGLPTVVGAPGQPPIMSQVAFGDAVGGLNGACAALTALIHARRTGQGQFIDLSMIECMMPFAAPWLTVHSVDGKPPTRYGTRHPDLVPHGCFRCAGADSWLVVAVSDDAMWPKLCRVLGRDDWASDGALATASGRRDREAEIEAAIAAWAAARSDVEALQALQAAGVAAGAARLPIELLRDPQLLATGFIQEVDRPFIGRHPQPSTAFREGDAPFPVRRAPPTLGQHNREVLGGLLGLTDAELARLAQTGIIGTEMLAETQINRRRDQAAG
ncbi:putative CoA-transferase [Chelatococcus reniformis]|uniref:CoA-transferase n=1 Tax=Chelatococcus reniformis TaxID=1494448 RepID=A0A916UHM1_9HYPH|nr:putative CoA-transferase [Chelatococcus reniformis]